MGGCKSLLSLPDSFCDLSNLTKLTLGSWRGCCPTFLSLPKRFGQLTNLTKESFMACIKHVERLPEDIVEHPHLRDATELDLRFANLIALPERFGQLKSLVKLNLHSCERLLVLPEGIPARILFLPTPCHFGMNRT